MKDIQQITCAVRLEVGYLYSRGLEPNRIYMNSATFNTILGQYKTIMRDIVEDGGRKLARIYDAPICICDDLAYGEIDISVRT